MQSLMDASGQDSAVMRAFYYRPWATERNMFSPRPCNLDEICMYAAEQHIDPYRLMVMCKMVGEYQEDLIGPLDLPSVVYPT